MVESGCQCRNPKVFWEDPCVTNVCPGLIEVVDFDRSEECIDLVCVVRACQSIEEGDVFVVVAEGVFVELL